MSFNFKQYMAQRKVRKTVRNAKSDVRQQIQKIKPDSPAALRFAYARYYDECAVQDNMIIYESYAGRGMICNPYAIFKRFMAREDFADYTHVWSIEQLGQKTELIEEYQCYPNVVFVERETEEYCRYLCTAKFLINNLSFPNYYTKKPEQIFINTWHGIPLKTLGFDIPDGRITGLNTIRNFLSVDVFLSPNRFMTERFQYAFCLEGLFEGHIMESGMPRNDNFFHTERQEIVDKLHRAGVKVDAGKKLIMYAPTWKGEKYSDPDTSTEQYFSLIEEIERNIDMDEYQVLVKPHQIVYKHIVDKGEQLTDKFVPATIDANEVLSIVDVLISDYSSIYFDYLASGRPILFYIPDLQEYQNSRGLYFGIDKLPGPIAQSLSELGEMVADIPKAVEPFQEKYAEEKEWACGSDDGNVCERVINNVIKKQDFTGMQTCDHTTKKKILLYSGDLKPGKTRTRLEGIIEKLDYDHYDLTLIVPHTAKEWCLNWIRSVDSRVRVLRRTGTHAVLEDDMTALELMAKHGMLADDFESYREYFPKEAYKREMVRIAGQTHFDYAMDFSKKSNYYTNLFSCLEGTEIISRKKLDEFCL